MIRYEAMVIFPTIFKNLISEENAASYWGLVNLIYPIVTSVCMVYLFNNLFKPRWRVSWITAGLLPFFLHLFIGIGIGWGPARGQLSGSWFVGYLAFLMAVSCIFYRGDIKAKIYIAATYCAIQLLALQLFLHTGYSLYQLAKGLRVTASLKQMPALVFYTCPLFLDIPYPENAARGMVYNVIFLLVLTGICLLVVLSTCYLAGKVRTRSWNMRVKALAFLLMPAGVGILFYAFMIFINQFLFESVAVELARRYGTVVYVMIPSLILVFLAVILYSCDIYEQIIALGEEKGRAATLESEMEQLERHILEIEQLYSGIRSMKHDMKNYLFDIKNLLDTRGIAVEEEEGLGAYFAGIEETLDRLNFSFYTGNPITDVVINGKYRLARQQEIDFTCSFSYPKEYGISAFDISVILNNALNNALEACGILKKRKPEAGLSIQVESYCRNNMFFIEIINSFDGIIRFEEEEHVLLTRKDNPLEHGIGFQNIRSCAEKYFGSLKYNYNGSQFCLTVMMQRVWDTERVRK